MTAKAKELTAMDETIDRLIVKAEAEAKSDPRAGMRFPFFRQVSIQVDDRGYPGFSRDICVNGIGLLHNMEIPLREVDITIPIAIDQKCKMRCRIARCQPCGQGWYISGGRFIGITPAAELDDELLDALLAAQK